MASLDPTVTIAPTASPFTLVPIIKDLVRTRFPVQGSIFLVEDIEVAALTKTGRWLALRLLLGDGELCIQALLSDTMHRFVHSGEISVGTYVRADDYQFRTRDILDQDGASKKMVFLVVHDLTTVGWNRSVQELSKQRRSQHEQQQSKQSEVALLDGTTAPSIDQSSPARKPKSPSRSVFGTPTTAHGSKKSKSSLQAVAQDNSAAHAFEEFEALAFTHRKPPKTPLKSPSKPSSINASDKQPMMPIALPRDWHDVQMPLKLTTLRSIPNLPYQQNWSCNILAIVTYLSPVEASHLPPYKQRTARVADPSTAKQVHLTVFLNPEDFNPTVGNTVLLIGVKNHKYDGGSLKKYASDTVLEKWWMEDPWGLKWCDVQGIKAWWAEMEAYLATQTAEKAIT
ncbi:hypothetical protein E4U42_000826 [Claviceps africana]|uniref:Cyclin-like F-box n=1 Tax=Claviceps africana TaxID=83212 RepID=A0A8K0JB68_9HYPO|nr:hypothetical protein E4U42_000826 [Claviceps africana]